MKPSRLAPFRDEIRELYRSGLSTTQIARLLGEPSYGAVQWLVRDILRPRNDAIALSKPPKSMKRSACYARARSAVYRRDGIRTSHQLHAHHRDGDITNNRLENLEVLPVGDHNRHHHALRRRRRAATP